MPTEDPQNPCNFIVQLRRKYGHEWENNSFHEQYWTAREQYEVHKTNWPECSWRVFEIPGKKVLHTYAE